MRGARNAMNKPDAAGRRRRISLALPEPPHTPETEKRRPHSLKYPRRKYTAAGRALPDVVNAEAPEARRAAAVSALGLGGGGAAGGLDPDAAKELALLLKLYAATYSSLGPAGGAAAATALLAREAALLDVVGRAGAQLEASVGAAAAAGYAHALATREVRAVRGAYSEGIAVKAMSEDLILARLDEDLSRTFG